MSPVGTRRSSSLSNDNPRRSAWRDPSEERTDGTENVAQRHENERNALRSLSTRCSMTPDAGTLAPVHGPPVPWRGFLKAMGEAGIVQRPVNARR